MPIPVPRSDAPGPRWVRDLLWLTAWGALAGGLGELALRVALYLTQRTVASPFHLNPQAVWMAPLVNAGIFLVPLALLGAVVRAPDARWRAGVFVAVCLAACEVGFISLRVHELASATFAAGVATVVARMAAERAALARRVLRASTLALALVSGVGGAAWNWKVERRATTALASLPPAAADAPNVLLLILDTVRASALEAYGHARATAPTLARLAGEGIRFDWAFASAPWTLPSHATMFTGRYPHELSTQWSTPLDGTHPTLAGVLATQGYATGGFVANLGYGMYVYGLDRGFARYRDYAITPAEAVSTSTLARRLLDLSNRLRHRYDMPGAKRASRVNAEFLAWHAGLGARPFFAFLNYYDAHSPYDPPAPFDTLFLGRQPVDRSVFALRRRSAAELQDLKAAYDAGIRYIDTEIARLLAELERRGALRNTIVIVTSDHGEAFGEHGHTGHTTSLYNDLLHVPLIVRFPDGREGGRVVPEAVTLRDLAETVRHLTGSRAAPAFPGRTLTRFWVPGDTGGSPSPVLSEVRRYYGRLPEWYPLATGDMQSLHRGAYHLIVRPGDRVELYAYRTDPLERVNLAGEPALADTLRALRAALREARRGAKDPG